LFNHSNWWIQSRLFWLLIFCWLPIGWYLYRIP
jgi:hypothetical protein